MMLVVPDKVIDRCTEVLRVVQGDCIDVGDYTNAQRINMVINDLQRHSVDVMQSIVIGRKQIIIGE